jgi:hypothetical protein
VLRDICSSFVGRNSTDGHPWRWAGWCLWWQAVDIRFDKVGHCLWRSGSRLVTVFANTMSQLDPFRKIDLEGVVYYMCVCVCVLLWW